MNMKNLLVSLLITLISVSGCGLFFPDTPEDPQGDKNVDPFSFKEILEYNNDQFDFEDYYYLFHESFIYVDPNLNEYSKTKLLSRLGTIESEYIGDSEEDTIIVNWFLVDPTSDDPYFDRERVITLQPRGYKIIEMENDSIPPDTLTGEATFKLRYDKVIQDWVISYWKDVPTDGSPKSFFHPEF